MTDLNKIIESLSPLERKIIPHLNLSIKEIREITNIDQTSLLRALKFLENKQLLKLNVEKKQIITLGTNGIYYKKNHLPERILLTFIEQNNHVALENAKKQSKLSDNEFKVSLGILKNKSYIEIKNGKLTIKTSREILTRKMPEEAFIELLPLPENTLDDEQRHILHLLQKRKEIIQIEEKSTFTFSLTETGKQIAGQNIKIDLIEEVTSDLIKNWKKGKKFRKYDLSTNVPKIHGGKRHFVNDAIKYAKQIWLDLGFQEMSGALTQSSFWNFDALFTAQDHPVREMQDTFYIKDTKSKLPEKSILKKIKQAHESGVDKSKGWQYEWSEQESERTVLRTHTTALSAKTISNLKPSDLPAKFFALGKCFRNETVDWSHGFEFNQTEGIVIDKNANFSNLLGYLKIFFEKMGFSKIKFTPAYFPYTEPSVEILAYHKEKETWLELGGAGIFRPEVVIPLFGENIPILAWGPGFDRIIMDYYKIKDLREMYANDLNDLRTKKVWVK